MKPHQTHGYQRPNPKRVCGGWLLLFMCSDHQQCHQKPTSPQWGRVGDHPGSPAAPEAPTDRGEGPGEPKQHCKIVSSADSRSTLYETSFSSRSWSFSAFLFRHNSNCLLELCVCNFQTIGFIFDIFLQLFGFVFGLLEPRQHFPPFSGIRRPRCCRELLNKHI